MKYYILVLVSCIFIAQGVSAKDKGRCSKNERLLANCFLKFKNYEINLSRDSIRVYDGIRRAVHKFPLKPSAEWKRVRWRNINERNFIELKIWDPSKSEAELQSLHWIVVELVREKMHKNFDFIVQKRRVSKSDKRGFILDPKKSHTLKAKNKSKKVIWKLGNKSGSI